MKETKARVVILMGSASDAETMKGTTETLKSFGVPYTARVLSAHRTPREAAEFVESAKENGVEVVICAAGGAAHLAGVAAAHTDLPVIGVPIESKSLKGLDSLLSTVQMPAGVPVGTVAIGSAGAKNAALFAVRILALSDKRLAEAITAHKKKMRDEVLAAKLEI